MKRSNELSENLIGKRVIITNYAQYIISGKEAYKILELLYIDKEDYYLRRKYDKYINHIKNI